jgi:hypothetical protein
MRPQGNITNSALLGISSLELSIFQSNRIAGLSAFALVEV